MFPNSSNQLVPGAPFSATAAEAQRGLLTRVFQWMALGLAMTGVSAVLIQTQPALLETILAGPLRWVLMFALVGMAIALQGFAIRMSAPVAFAVFFAYSALMGVAIAPIFWAYTGESIAAAFFVSAGTFAGMTAYGYVTKRDLSGMRTFLMMGLFGLIIATLVNAFAFGFGNRMLYWLTTYVGVLVFTGLAAYDAQRIKVLAQSAGPAAPMQLAIQCATIMYLDFVNLFIYLLRIVGRPRD